jgi:colanic acid/amylovoran biosynthesis protein
MKFFFAGHTTFGNRGCEALIRSTVGLIRSRQPDARFVVPSSAIELDRKQWPQAESQGVDFIEAPAFPASIKWWNRAGRVLPVVERTLVPHHRLPNQAREALAGCDAMIMSGGDVISLDYGLASLYDWTGYSENAIELGKPVCLWAASVGPFSSKPFVERFIAKHLTRYSALSVRESATLGYLQGMGLQPDLVADPAFTMAPEAFDHTPLMPSGSDGCLGLNVSPLVRGYRSTESSKRALDAELMQFVEHIVNTTDLGVLLIPHVGPLNGGSTNSDHHYMENLLKNSALVNSSRVKLAPAHLNAAQLKHLISTCRYFVGARTHATIAAFSTGVPTISIAYSVKAKGINNDLFGDTRFVLDTPAVSKNSLLESFARLREEEAGIREFLPVRIERVKKQSAAACDGLFRIFDRRSGT